MARKFAAVVFSLGCVHASPLMALGLGEMTLDSYLNEPLKAQVDLLNVGGLHEDQIRVRLATSDDFKRMGVDRAYFLTSITFNVAIDDSGRARILITSQDPVLEPYLDLIVEARWPSGRLLREYTVLVDPPVFDDSNPVISASDRVAAVDGEAAPAKKKQEEAVATSGTRVDVRNSQLAPGEMPSRAFNASTSPAPVPGTRYMIHRDDTLWEIASRSRPGGASVHQTMLDIQRLNPDAFIGGNINRIKAGYIIYLPKEGDISSADLADAMAEVSEQNKAWREGKSSETDYGSRPTLRISAEPEDASAAAASAQGEAAASPAALEDVEKSQLERTEMEQRLASMEQQVETLQRIVSLKDDQIAALQGVIAGGEGAAGDAASPADGSGAMGEPEGEAGEAAGDGSQVTAEAGTDVAVVAVETEVVEAEEPATLPDQPSPEAVAPMAGQDARPEETGGFFSNLWFVLGAVVLAVLGILYIRRRKPDEEAVIEADVPAQSADAFANVELTDQVLEVEDTTEPVEAPVPDEAPATRGYGERKHDEYASDEASDALAEAEIYIAYGRYPQAIDLLRNALANDPDNADYRLKLLQLFMQTGNRSAAMQQYAELESIGDAGSIASAKALLQGGVEAETSRKGFATEGGLEEADLLADSDDSLESDFSGLEIEEPGSASGIEDDLDLSADFDDSGLTSERLEEDLVLAAESNGMSTKLDLARAYMDMGDDDGARQILEEVAAEGNQELQAEARELLERLD